MSTPLRISGCLSDSIVDGPGMRYVIFVQGCPHHCPGCHNPQTHDFAGGYLADTEEILRQIEHDPLMSGVTFSGGEPFCQAEALRDLGQRIRALGKSITIYSGYTYEELLQKSQEQPEILELLKLADLLIDGRYVQEQRDLSLRFRGSTNQRMIELKNGAAAI